VHERCLNLLRPGGEEVLCASLCAGRVGSQARARHQATCTTHQSASPCGPLVPEHTQVADHCVAGALSFLAGTPLPSSPRWSHALAASQQFAIHLNLLTLAQRRSGRRFARVCSPVTASLTSTKTPLCVQITTVTNK
jgi:hypothetical protein